MTTVANRLEIQFARGVPPLEAIPTADLVAHAKAALDEARDTVFQYAPLGRYQGDPRLREQLAAFHSVDPDTIFVSNGSLQVLDLIASLLLDGRNNLAFVEAPTYDRAVQIFRRHGWRVEGIPIDSDGLDLDALRSRLKAGARPNFLYTIPDFQNPSGVTMSEAKRQFLVQLAADYGFTILEDVPYRELRYHGEPQPPLSKIAVLCRVVTVGSLTKLLSPGLRIGYAISDWETSRALALLAENTYLSPSPLCQEIAARCIAAGVLKSNILRVRDLLRPRHDAAVATCSVLLGDSLMAIPNGGYFFGLTLHVGMAEAEFLTVARAEGVVLTPGSAFYPPGSVPVDNRIFLRIPFHSLEPAVFAQGLSRLVAVAQRVAQ